MGKRGFLRTVGTALAFAAGFTVLAGPYLPGSAARAEGVTEAHGLALFGDVKYPPGFAHFDYANPDAPKGGTAVLSAIGGFDNLNPFIVKGDAATGLGLMYDTLLTNSLDEPSTEYGLIASTARYPEDRGWVEFDLRPEARWHDGQPITVDDVVFSLDLLKDKGAPFYRYYYGNVVKAEAVGPATVRFTFSQTGNRELPQIIGQLPILPKHYWEGRTFEDGTLEPPLGSGPYRIGAFDAGRSITYERVADWWAKDLPVSLGHHNFDLIRYEYFGDPDVAHEAFKAGSTDFVAENSAKRWATGYDFPAVREGLVKTMLKPDEGGQGMQGWVFNTRRDRFADSRVRQALAYAFDFEFANKTFFYGQYARTRSFFQGSELAATGLPSPAELAILEPLRGQIPEEVFTTEYNPPATGEGSADARRNLRTAVKLLADAGWTVKDGVLTNASGQPMEMEFLLVSGSGFDRITAPLVENFKKLGIKATVRAVDVAQYQNRLDGFDFDVVVGSFRQSLSPGNEQRDFWGSEAAGREGSRNLAGIRSPAIDALIERLIFATNREDLVTATRALDRVLQWGHYVIPQWHLAADRVAYWDKFGFHDPLPSLSVGFPSIWWLDAAKAAAVGQAKP